MIRAVFMASGRGKRFGGDKLLHEFDGVPMAERVFSALPADVPGIVVTGDERIAALARTHENLSVTQNPDDRDDMSLTVRTGTLALPEDTEGALYFVCDQPWLTGDTVNALLSAFRRDPRYIYVPADGEREGNPCLFPREFFPALCALPPDRGGKHIIRQCPERVMRVQVQSPQELEDIDLHP